MSSRKEKCKYWEKCYRRNPQHLADYLHPNDIPGLSPGEKKKVLIKDDISNHNTVQEDACSSLKCRSPARHLPCPNKLEKDIAVKADAATLSTVKRSVDTEGVPEQENRKRRKVGPALSHDRYYFTKVVGHPDKFSDGIALNFRDILSLGGEKLLKTWQFTYMVDLDWLLEEYPDNAAEGPIFLFLGEQQAHDVQEQIISARKTTSNSTKYSRVIVVPVPLPLSYGTHHTKLMILQSESGVRVVIHTANLIMGDWTVKTQGVWISPLCPVMTSPGGCDDVDCLGFKSYFIKYLQSYHLPATDHLCRILSQYDMSQIINVKLVGSVPGMHKDKLFGYPRLQHLLSLYVDGAQVRPGWRIVANCSSIGSLGAKHEDWLKTFVRALQTTNSVPQSTTTRDQSTATRDQSTATRDQSTTTRDQSTATRDQSTATRDQSTATRDQSTATRDQQLERPCLFQLVFPTVDMIRNSLEGYCGGGSVPYQLQTHRRQPWLRDHMCKWESDYGRSRVVPHIKTYCRISPDMRKVAWFLLTSSNLSKAAWGQMVGSELRVRSYELGVLFVDKNSLPVLSTSRDETTGSRDQAIESRDGVMIPYCLPPKPYSKSDKPWMCDVAYSQLDTHGNKWPILE